MKQDRVLELFFRGLRGEDISTKNLAAEYEVSTKSISRDISTLKAFLAEHRELVGTPSYSIHITKNATAFIWMSFSRIKSCFRSLRS